MKRPLCQTIYAIVGPTCTGKTSLGIALAKNHPFEIISADSRLIYKEMDIGTAKPSKEEQGAVAHHMIDLVFPNEDYSVSLYKQQSEKTIEEIFSRENIPLFVGGTGLYLNSALTGLSIPKVEPDKELRKTLNLLTEEELVKRLREKDEKALEKIHPNDKYRLVRAIEVIEKTGKKFSELKQINELPFNVVWIGLTFEDREKHCEIIRQRSEKFLENGFIDEVKGLLEKYGELQLFKSTIGYLEAIEYIKGNYNKDEFIESLTLSTRQFAKRQRTWFRTNKDINWFYLDKNNFEEIISESEKFLVSFPRKREST